LCTLLKWSQFVNSMMMPGNGWTWDSNHYYRKTMLTLFSTVYGWKLLQRRFFSLETTPA
jgi:hypothetical protein